MGRLSKDAKHKKNNLIHQTLAQHGIMTIKSLAELTNLSQYQVRSTIEELMDQEIIELDHNEGRTLYFKLTKGSNMPSVLGSKGYIPLPELMEKIAQGSTLVDLHPSQLMIDVLSTIYIQPIYAQAKNAIDDRILEVLTKNLKESIVKYQNFIAVLQSILNKTPMDVSTYQGWYNDTRYNAQLAYELYRMKHPDDTPYALEEAFNELTGRKLNYAAPVEKETTDDSDS